MCSEVHLPGTNGIIMNSYIKCPLDLLGGGGGATFYWGTQLSKFLLKGDKTGKRLGTPAIYDWEHR